MLESCLGTSGANYLCRSKRFFVELLKIVDEAGFSKVKWAMFANPICF